MNISYVSEVPEHHDRIVWRNRYYHLPLLSAEPDWKDSSTMITELWKNPLIPIGDRLQIADGAVKFRDDIIDNLRRQLKAEREWMLLCMVKRQELL